MFVTMFAGMFVLYLLVDFGFYHKPASDCRWKLACMVMFCIVYCTVLKTYKNGDDQYLMCWEDRLIIVEMKLGI